MTEPTGTFHISGGQQNFGGANASFSQTYNFYAGHGDEFRDILALLREQLVAFADKASAREQIVVIERALARGGPEERPAVHGALETLANQVNAGTTLADAIAKAINLVVQHWPF